MQVNSVAGVWLNVGFESLRGWESPGHATWDRLSHRCRASSRHAVATTEDEVLICDGSVSGVAISPQRSGDSLPTRTWTGPVKCGTVGGEPPRVRTSPVVKGCLVASSYRRIPGSKKPG